MTQKELKIIKSINYNAVGNECWGVWGATDSSSLVHDTVENVEIPYTHFYVYREETFNKNPRLNEFQDSSFPDPDLTLEAANGQIIDFYYIKMED